MTVHHRIDGDGPGTVILCNALGTTTAVWESPAEALAQGSRVVRWDAPGHGESRPEAGIRTIAGLADRLIDLMDELAIARASIAGLSLGGCVALWMAVNAPERVDRVVLACTSDTFGAAEGWLDRAATVRAGGTEAVADAAMPRWFSPVTRAERPAVVGGFRDQLIATDDECYAGCCEALAEWDATAQLGTITAPVLVVAGELDPTATPEDSRAMAGRIPGARFEVLAGAAHLASIDRPEPFTRLVAGHLAP
jgi:3-oxoadipate enol-lactonase